MRKWIETLMVADFPPNASMRKRTRLPIAYFEPCQSMSIPVFDSSIVR